MKLSQSFRQKNTLFKGITFTAAITVLLIVIAVFIVLLIDSWPAISRFGVWNFLKSTEWDPYRELFGAAHVLYGSLITTFLALLLAVPIALGISIFVTQVTPPKIRSTVSTSIELLAAIPSIIYGMWGLFILAPIMADHVEPFLQSIFGSLPFIKIFFEGQPIGIDILTASLILAIMIIPYISSVIREAFDQIPAVLKESAFGLASTRWEVIYKVLIPYIKRSILGGIILGFGRALGETMAVAFVLGNSHQISFSLFDATATITVTMANEFTEADGDLYLSTLFYIGLILFVLSFALLGAAKFWLLRREEA